MIKLSKKQWIQFAIVFFLGAFWLFAIRFVTFSQDETHYHANFAVFVDGERLQFEEFFYYEEIASCGGNGADNPKIRAHMHDQIDHVVHVHDNGVAWGHFFANLGFANGDDVFKTRDGVYVEDEDSQIRFIINDQEVQTTANRTIGDLDVLLVSIGNPTDEDLDNQYAQIERDAAIYNENDDPSACSGEEEITLWVRFKAALGVN